MSDDNTEYIRVDLEDSADFSRLHEHADDDGVLDRGPGRQQLLADVLPVTDKYEIRTVKAGGYQGTLLFLFRLDGYVWLVKDSYGSCSHCDGYLAADDADAYEAYARSMCRNAYAFENTNDAVRFLDKRSDEGTEMSTFARGWSPLVDDAIDELATI